MHYRKDNPLPKRTFHRFTWNVYNLIVYQFHRYAIMAWIIMALAISGGFYRLETFTGQNHERIVDIQNSRIEVCRIIFEGMRTVFKPLIPPKMKRDIDKFNHSVTNQKQKCIQNVINTGRKG